MSDIEFTIHEGRLVLTVPPRAVMFCEECESYHITIGPATEEYLVGVGAGIIHLADHLDERVRKGRKA